MAPNKEDETFHGGAAAGEGSPEQPLGGEIVISDDPQTRSELEMFVPFFIGGGFRRHISILRLLKQHLRRKPLEDYLSIFVHQVSAAEAVEVHEQQTDWELLVGSLREMGVAGEEQLQASESPVELQFTSEELEAGQRKAQRDAFTTLLRQAQVPYDGQWLGGWLRDVRVKQGLTAAEVGDLFELSEAEWLDVESKQEKVASLSATTVAAILDVFQLPLPRAMQMLCERTDEDASRTDTGALHEELEVRMLELCHSTALELLLVNRVRNPCFRRYACSFSPGADMTHDIAGLMPVMLNPVSATNSPYDVWGVWTALERTQMRLKALSKPEANPVLSAWTFVASERSGSVAAEPSPHEEERHVQQTSPFGADCGDVLLGDARPKTRA